MRVIPIQGAGPGAASASCNEELGDVPKMNLPLARREFLKGSGVLMGTLAAGSVLAALAPSPVWALELKALSKAEGETLMAMGRVLYPHEKLPDAVYALLAKDLDAKASADPATAQMLRDGVASLDKAAGGPRFSVATGNAPRSWVFPAYSAWPTMVRSILSPPT